MIYFRYVRFVSYPLWVLLFVFFWCASCKKGVDSDPLQSIPPDRTDFAPTDEEKMQSAAPGLGNSIAQPTGKLFAWPAGVTLRGPVQGQYGSPPDSVFQIGGNGLHYVSLVFNLHNSTAQPIQTIFPGGLVFISDDKQRQNGILIQDDTIPLKPGLTTIEAGLYCLNDNRLATDDQTTYQLGPVTQLPAMVDLISLLRTKSVTHWSRLSAAQIKAYSFPIQTAVWQIAHMGQLPAGLRSQLEQLP